MGDLRQEAGFVEVITLGLIGTLGFYKQVVSPLFPRACRFVPTCSEYARQALGRHGLGRGLLMTVGRLCRCHPFHPGGWDPPR